MADESEEIEVEPSFLIVNKQLQDLIRVQNTALTKFQAMSSRRENCVSQEDYSNLSRQLEEERFEHIKTKAKLAGETEKLQFALGEIDILNKQLQREKNAFETAFGKLKSRAIEEANQKEELQTKCEEMEEVCTRQDDVLSSKDAKIKDLKSRLTRQKQTHKQTLSDLEIQRAQEKYILQNAQKTLETSRRIRQRHVSFR